MDNDSLKQGKFLAYHQNGKISFLGVYENNRLKDTARYFRNDLKNTLSSKRYFFENGTNYYVGYSSSKGLKKQEGLTNKNDQRIGIWKNYDEQGNLDFIKEYKAIDGKEGV